MVNFKEIDGYVLVVEPHPDDIVQSCPELLDLSKLIILTCYNEDERSNIVYLKRNSGILLYTISLPEIHFDNAEKFDFDEWRLGQQIYYNTLGIKVEYSYVKKLLTDTLTMLYNCYNVECTVVCLGFYHPHHTVVSKIVRDAAKSRLIYYVDQPYYMDHRDEFYEKLNLGEDRIVRVPTDIDRYQLMRELYRPKYLTGREHKIKESLYIEALH